MKVSQKELKDAFAILNAHFAQQIAEHPELDGATAARNLASELGIDHDAFSNAATERALAAARHMLPDDADPNPAVAGMIAATWMEGFVIACIVARHQGGS